MRPCGTGQGRTASARAIESVRRYLPDAAVDLVYLDPPFNSNRDDNVIFRDESGNATDAQLLAFEDTWHWGPSAEATYAYLTNTPIVTSESFRLCRMATKVTGRMSGRHAGQ